MLKRIYKRLLSEKMRNEIIFFLFRLRAFYYYGNKKYCNCCDRSFRRFIPHGNIVRKEAACPYCASLERTRLLLFYLQRETNIFKGGQKILHFAPERMIEQKLKSTKNEYISADINAALADQQIDITNIPYRDNYFDYIICSHVLGHVPDEQKGIDEMIRTLRPSGRAIILTVINPELETTFENSLLTNPEEKLIYYGENDLVRLHGKDFVDRLKRSNVSVEAIDYRLQFSELERLRYNLGDGNREKIFICEKLF